ncbi:MAG: aminopeptidase P family protein [Clostridia bacterium]|nr:aminopeptidase P family protein [Clostridia bacterium]
MTRAEILREKIADFADGILLTDEISQYYISGFRFTDGYVLLTKQNAYLLTDFRYIEAAKALAPAGFTLLCPRGASLCEEMKSICRRDGVHILAFEENRISFAAHEELCKALDVIGVSARHTVERMRACKDKSEIDCIKKAQAITDLAFTHILKTLTPQMTEIEVALELEYFMRKNGGEEKSFDTIAVSGAASSMPHGVPQNRKLSAGFLTMDFGCTVAGYHSDMTRTVCLGKATPEMKRIYSTVRRAQQSAIEGAKVGMKCAAIDAIARNIIEDAGYHGAFGHSLGHSVGLEIHESPNFAPRSADFFQSGNVVTVEPGIYLSGVCGCRIEDMICAEGETVVDLTASDKDLLELF